MSFELREKDLLGRIGRLETKSGTIETPALLPVINPRIQLVKPKDLLETFGCKALITNAYIIQKQCGRKAVENGVHKLLGYDGIVMTDSGAYQILIYGDVQAGDVEIVRFQEQIKSDIATILDIPTGWKVSRNYASSTVEETLRRAERLWKIKTRSDIIWVGPIQGGQYLDLVARSARKMSKMPFQIHALGSPTPVMEQYFFDLLVDMIMAAKTNLPRDRPLHLFGAGHPFMLSLAVALGCDLFDSAAYALFARDGRYMTKDGTARLNELEYLPCSCPVCAKNDPADLFEKSEEERQKLLAEHNLFVSFAELRLIKQAISEGRLWEHLEMKAHAHPALLQALKQLRKYEDHLEEDSPITKSRGLFFFDSVGLSRPEVVRHRGRLAERYSTTDKAEILIFLPQTSAKPFHKAQEWQGILSNIHRNPGEIGTRVLICVYSAPFGVVPLELDEVYPLSQHEVAVPLDRETADYVADEVAAHIERTNCKKVILLEDRTIWGRTVTSACRRTCKRKNIGFSKLRHHHTSDESFAERLAEALRL